MAVITASNPPTVRAPTGYTHCMLIEGEQRRLVMSGQVGVALDGSVPSTGEGQVAQVFANLRALLEANGAARDAVYAGHAPCSTLLFVAGLADPRFMVEIEAEAVA